MEHEWEKVGERPDIMREKSVSVRQVCFIDKESGAEEEGNDEGCDKDGGIPTLDRSLSERKDEAEASAGFR